MEFLIFGSLNFSLIHYKAKGGLSYVTDSRQLLHNHRNESLVSSLALCLWQDRHEKKQRSSNFICGKLQFPREKHWPATASQTFWSSAGGCAVRKARVPYLRNAQFYHGHPESYTTWIQNSHLRERRQSTAQNRLLKFSKTKEVNTCLLFHHHKPSQFGQI